MYIIFRKKSAAITGLPGGNLSGDVFESAIFVFKYHELIRLIIPCQALDTLSISFSRARWSGFLCNVEVALSTTFGRPLLNWIPLIGYSVQFGWTWMSSNDPLLRYTFWPWILLPLLYFSLCLTKKKQNNGDIILNTSFWSERIDDQGSSVRANRSHFSKRIRVRKLNLASLTGILGRRRVWASIVGFDGTWKLNKRRRN